MSVCSRFDAGAYNRLQLLRAARHSVDAHTAALQPATDSDSNDDEQSTASTSTTSTAPCPAAAAADEPADCCVVCLVAPREGVGTSIMRTRSLLRELCEQTGYARLLSRVPCKHQHGHAYLHVG